LPFEVGARWVFRDPTGGQLLLVCCRRIRAEGGDWLGIMRVDRGSRLEFWRERDGTIERCDGPLVGGRVTAGPATELVLQREARWEWKVPPTEAGDQALACSGRRNNATLTVPAGRFECTCASLTMRRQKEVVRTFMYAFAPGVGPVSIVQAEPGAASARTFELVSHEPGIPRADEPLLNLVGDHVDAEHGVLADKRTTRDWLSQEIMREPELLAFGDLRFVRVMMIDGELRYYSTDGKAVQRIPPDSRDYWGRLARATGDPKKVVEACAAVTASMRVILGAHIVPEATAVRVEAGKTVATASSEGKNKAGVVARCRVELTLTGEAEAMLLVR
jgi:hypothetical protein